MESFEWRSIEQGGKRLKADDVGELSSRTLAVPFFSLRLYEYDDSLG